MAQPEAKHAFEASWEVCNKVGGIYTVVSSKALQMIKTYGDNYWLIGPYFPRKAYGVFEETLPPEYCKQCFDNLREEGIDCHFGKWLVKGNPNVILIDFTKFSASKNSIKEELWNTYKLDTLRTEWFDFDEPVIWSWAAGRVIETLAKAIGKEKIVAQFHEWLAGAGLLYLKSRKANVATVFTTHATMLGRTLSSENINLYATLDTINPEEEAKKRGPGIFAKCTMEKLCAQHADAFTTVSEITGIEATRLLERKPDVILPNGLDMEKFPTTEEASIKHRLFRDRIKRFIMFYFFPYYSFDINDVLIFFIAGRYEFHDKGIDTYLNALAELNEHLKKEKSNKTVVAFLWVPGNIRGIKPELLENRTFFYDIRDLIDDSTEDIKSRIMYLLVAQKELDKKSIFDEDTLDELKRKTMRFLRKGTPPLSTHDLYNEDQDQIMRSMLATGLDNQEDDRVKVVFYPIYLTGADGLLDTSYYESMMGSHLGVFPSVYEPWGYTPLEAAALGVSSVTTDLSGFGRYLCTECAMGKYPGIWVLKRYGKTDQDAVEELAEIMCRYTKYSAHERVENKIAAKKLAATADWARFVEHYIEAHNFALEHLIK